MEASNLVMMLKTILPKGQDTRHRKVEEGSRLSLCGKTAQESGSYNSGLTDASGCQWCESTA
jgi:hypothetical protein